MTYGSVHKGIFHSRPNRFIAEVEIDGVTEICHVKNTGRCKELLIPGAEVYVNRAENSNRSTKYDLIAVYKGNMLVNMDSYAPNIAFGEYLRQGRFFGSDYGNISHIKSEAKYGASRFDFYAETAADNAKAVTDNVEPVSRKAYIEVKGVTLEENGIAMFPDAPTERGIKHLNELAACIAAGYDAYAVFVVQMSGVRHFTPNYKTHAAFGETLARVIELGVKAVAFDCMVKPDEMIIGNEIPIVLNR